jgi:hypothetical protein
MDGPIDPVKQSTEYVGLPKIDPWHESEKHKKKRFAKMLEDQIEDQKSDKEETDDVVVSIETAKPADGGQDDSGNQPEQQSTESEPEKPVDDEPPSIPAHIDLKG